MEILLTVTAGPHQGREFSFARISLLPNGGDSATLTGIGVKIEVWDGAKYVQYNPYPNYYPALTNGNNWSAAAFTNLPGNNTWYRVTAKMGWNQTLGGVNSDQSTTGSWQIQIP
jgi:hypothetical protein